MKTFKKLRNNLFSGRAVSVLGPTLYARYLATFFASTPKIMMAGVLSPLDKSMGIAAKKFHYRGRTFFFDCQFCDEHLEEDSFGFGIAREIYIRDCYFKWHPGSVYDHAKTVIDLGANRGAFSALMTTQAKFILSVECGKQYDPIIRHNMKANKYTNYAIETALIGAGGASAELDAPRITMNELFRRHEIESVDLIKMDIEGSEFALFESADWLKRVNAISMEVHPLYGTPHAILNTIHQHGFAYVIADENLQRIDDARRAHYIYAWKNA